MAAVHRIPERYRIRFFFVIKAVPNRIYSDLTCDGECASGGVPLCYYGAFNRLEQFVDSRGAHCQCFHGFVGVGCDKTG